MQFFDAHRLTIIAAGLLLGVLGVLLTIWGNPQNSGICVSCFMENSAGALGLHANERMQYLRPELIGFVLGSLGMAGIGRDFRTRGNGSIEMFLAGLFLMIGCTIFIGCPIKLFLRLTAGDLSTLTGLLGLVAGVWLGIKGYAAGVEEAGNEKQGSNKKGVSTFQGLMVPALFLLFLLFLFFPPLFLVVSERGSAAVKAPMLISLAVGLLLGAFAQRSRFCITGALRDMFLLGFRSYLIWGGIAFILGAFITAMATGNFNPGLYGQPGSHLDLFWSFLGMFLVGWLSIIIGGCPFRLLVRSGEGDLGAGMAVVGMLIGAGIAQTWDIAATSAGVSLHGKVALLIGMVFTAGMALIRLRQQ